MKKDSAANRGEEAYEYMEAPMAGPSSSFGFDPAAATPQYYPPSVQPEPTAYPMAPGLQQSFSLHAGFHGALPSPLIGSSADRTMSPIPLEFQQLLATVTPSSYSPLPSPTITSSSFGQGLSLPNVYVPLLRRGASRRPISMPPRLTASHWTDSCQERFEMLITRLTASANLPHRWVENPEWVTLVAKFIPGAKLFSRNKLTKTLIPQELERVQGLAQKNLKDLKVAEGTFQLDGWTGGNYHHFLGFMFMARSKINLVVGNYFKKSGAKFLEASAEADQVIKWLRSKTQVLAILRKVQEEQGVSSPLTVIRAVLTRWTSHYLAYWRLLDLKNWITQVIPQDRGRVEARQESQLVTGDREAKEKAKETLAIIDKAIFWHRLARIKVHLMPLALAANILQSTSSRLDHVALVFGTLFLRFTNLAEDKDADANEEEICQAVCNSLNKRWLDSDQGVLVAAVILNPHTRAAPLKSFRHADVITLLARIWKRLFSSDTVPPAFYNEVKEYISDTGTYADMPNLAASLRNPDDPDHSAAPLEVWKLFMTASGPVSPLQRLAERIFSVCPNIAPVKCFFSLLK
ncbi:uncharacterized protein PHACADRAFT_202419 [Phanerochaete carnosa HHB-10118-sp]|uniref:HAT C-terminal dimerisation domain-containing protein n=1 Tax=Phanerochaete carnosa (strain HHB-10118-sp) TaxID=650164 RepID=K5WF25_PHACS|nr:uncharacterized protein PHACADRAFT_202419 [Phanerochaete carnosa HHB-10118-sp]EKM48772.1 hypothetical protein PHACADRAFT_202419 [Phanerochaete carnosa HHB-10118-sp]